MSPHGLPPLLPVLARRSVAQARYVLLGCLTVLAALQFILVGQAASLEESRAFGHLTDLVPAFMQRGLGNQALLLVTFKGTVAAGYFHPVVGVVVAVLAIYFATEVAYEVEAGLVDLVLARPVRRRAVVTRSVLLATAAVLLAVLVMGAGTWLGLRLLAAPDADPPSVTTRVLMLAHLAAVAACFGGFALAVAAGARRWSTAFTTAALTLVILYLIDFVAIGWAPMRTLAWLSPFHYYPALAILAGTAPPWQNLAILLTTALIFTAIGYWRFERRDL